MEKVDFKEVVKFIRFNILANIPNLTPNEFAELSDAEKLSVYTQFWQGVIDACNYLSSSLDMDKLLAIYSKSSES